MADQQNFQNLIDKLKGVMPTGDTSGNALNPSAPPQNFLGQILNKSGLGDEKQSDPDAVQSMQSPIDYVAGGVGAKLGESLAPSISKVAGNEIGSIGNLKPASYESPVLGKNLADEADAAVSKITKEGLNKSPTEAALNDMSDNVIPMNQESKDALPLDMSKDARMQRAKDMGFDTSKTYYHGSPYNNIEEFNPNMTKHGLYGQGFYLTDNPEIASEYSNKGATSMIKNGKTPNQTVYPVQAAVKNPIDMDAPADLKSWHQGLKDAGYDQSDRNAIIKTADSETNGSLYKSLERYLQDQEIPDYEGAEQAQGVLRAMGHDSVKHVGGNYASKTGIQHNVVIPFEPHQIRSVNATFDPAKKASGNILAGLGGAGLLSATKDDDQDKFDQIKQLLQRR